MTNRIRNVSERLARIPSRLGRLGQRFQGLKGPFQRRGGVSSPGRIPRRFGTTAGGLVTESHPGLPKARPIPSQSIFVGRQSEMARCAALVTQGGSARVNLYGPSGIGKSSLAAMVAREQTVQREFGENIVWIDVGKSDLTELYDCIARATGCLEAISQPTLDDKAQELSEFFGRKHFLVILNNLAGEEATQIFALQVKNGVLLATSQSPIPNFSPAIGLGLLPRVESLELLSAHLKRRSFTLADKALLEVIANKELRGYPLALVLAAGQLVPAERTPESLLQGLREAASRAGREAKKAPDRALSLALDTAFADLPEQARTLFCSLAAFGGWDFALEAAKNLVADWDVSWLTTLRRRHLVGFETQSQRYSLHPYVRNFAQAKLASVDPRKHAAEYFLKYVQDHSRPTGEDHDALVVEMDNIIASASWTHEQSMPGGGPTTVPMSRTVIDYHKSLYPFLCARSYWNCALDLGGMAQEAAKGIKDEADEAQVTLDLAVARDNLFHVEEAHHLYAEALRLKVRTKDESGMAATLARLGVLEQQEQLDSAWARHSMSLEMNRKLGNMRGIAFNLVQMANIASRQGRFAEALELAEEARDAARRLKDDVELNNMALDAQKRITDERNKCLEELEKSNLHTLHICRQLGRHLEAAEVLRHLGAIAHERGHLEVAKTLYSESLDKERDLQHIEGMAENLLQLGCLAREQGQFSTAYEEIGESLANWEKLGDEKGKAGADTEMGRLLEQMGKPEESLQYYHQAMAFWEKDRLPQNERIRKDLDLSIFRVGRAMLKEAPIEDERTVR